MLGPLRKVRFLVDSDDVFHSLVSELIYPMFIVTAAVNETRAGCLVGFVTQASIEPARLIVMLSKANKTFEVARESRSLAVHFLSQNNARLAALFGEQTGDEVDKFASCDWRVGRDGVPLLTGSRGWVIGEIIDRIDVGDHVAHLLALESAEIDTAGSQLSNQAVRGFDPGHPA
jgi:flavin reductase (DIM6/NTAB) family NADH-FMN oxidoreductase RutF